MSVGYPVTRQEGMDDTWGITRELWGLALPRRFLKAGVNQPINLNP